MHQNGQGVPQDYTEAARWYRLAADQGLADAQSNLGQMYTLGNGVPQDYVEAARLYKLAADQGNASAQMSLGNAYANGVGVIQDYETAHMWANIASANGSQHGSSVRDRVAGRMTPADITEAQRRARVCMASNYQDCD
jgi:TPR repeat protein